MHPNYRSYGYVGVCTHSGRVHWDSRNLGSSAINASSHLVDRGVVNDLVGDVHLLIGVRLSRLIRHLHRALHAPAEAVRLRQPDGNVPLRSDVNSKPYMERISNLASPRQPDCSQFYLQSFQKFISGTIFVGGSVNIEVFTSTGFVRTGFEPCWHTCPASRICAMSLRVKNPTPCSSQVRV